MGKRIAAFVFFLVGWISGGGMLTLGAMILLTSLIGHDFNEAFVTGCLWGTFGTFAGKFMVWCLRQKAAEMPLTTQHPEGGDGR